MGRKGLELIMDAKLRNSATWLPPPPLARSRGLGLGARERQGPAAPCPPAVHGASDLGWLKVLRVRPLAQARFLRGRSSGRLGAWKAWAWPVPRGGGGTGTGLEGPCHVAQEMAALCSLAFMRRAAMLEVLRSGSPLSS